jgi:hypothetical protein
MDNLKDPFEWGKIKGITTIPKGFIKELQLLNLALGTGRRLFFHSG